MAKRVFSCPNMSFTTPTALGSLCTASQFLALKGGSGTQYIDVLEVYINGTNTSSAVGGFMLARPSVIETGAPTGLATPNSDGPMNPATAVLGAAPVTFIVSATNPPTPSSTPADTKMNLGLNAFGGIVRWNAAPTQMWSQVGNTATLGETVLFNSSSAGGTSCTASANIMYEPM